ncbi:MAG: hypothetical protein RMM08_11690, partial [Armatimonadota bacterium]|nr:hypothetical protein [Armatimonadota bacterium]
HHGLARQQEALSTYAQANDYAGIYDLYSQAVGSAVLIPSRNGNAYRYYLMTRLSEVQWLQREDDEAIILWDFRNEVVVVIRLQEGHFDTRVLASTIECEEATPVGTVA